MVGLLIAAGVMGLFVVLPIGGADMPDSDLACSTP